MRIPISISSRLQRGSLADLGVTMAILMVLIMLVLRPITDSVFSRLVFDNRKLELVEITKEMSGYIQIRISDGRPEFRSAMAANCADTGVVNGDQTYRCYFTSGAGSAIGLTDAPDATYPPTSLYPVIRGATAYVDIEDRGTDFVTVAHADKGGAEHQLNAIFN